jgi:hypothetical protein
MYKQRTGRAAVRVAGQFRVPTEQVGSTSDGRVNVYYDPSLEQDGLDVANAILPKLDKLFADNDLMFGVTGKTGNIIIAAQHGRTDGLGGAVHGAGGFNDDSPEASDWYEDVAFGNPDLTFGLVQAEVSESYMELQALGWDAGGSNGEALSRFLAEQVTGGPQGAVRAYSTGQFWAQANFPNWIDATENTDTDGVSTGCGVVYLYWMLSQGFTPTELVQAACPDGTLASNYKALTGKATAWADFKATVDALTAEIDGDDPWQSGMEATAAARPAGTLILTIDPVAKTITVPPGYRILSGSGGRVMKPAGR